MPIALITRRFTFSASHRLGQATLSEEENFSIYGKCAHPNGHGHNYVLEITLKGPVNPETGFVWNLGHLKEVVENRVLNVLDHRYLNLDVAIFQKTNPTTENLAIWIWKQLIEHVPQNILYEVKLHETENNSAVYRGE